MGGLVMLERFIWFDRELQKGRYPNATRLARKFEVSLKTAQRTIDFMRDRMGAPFEYDSSRKGYVYTETGFKLPHLRTTQEEVLSFLLARNLLSHAAGGLISREIDRFGRKLFLATKPAGITGNRLDNAFSAAWHGYSPAHGESFQTVSRALLEHRFLEFTYKSPAADQETRRRVEPHHLRHYMATWVLTAFCHNRMQWRTFLIARMSRMKIIDKTFSPRPEAEWQCHLDGAFGIFQGDCTTKVVLRFNPFRARWIREQLWHPDQTIRNHKDGGLDLEFPVADFREVKMMILQFGADVEVVEPAELREILKDEIERMACVYG